MWPKRMQASTSSAKRWRDDFEQAGAEGLDSTPNPGLKSRLTVKQQEQLAEILLCGAQASGYSKDLWTYPRVLEVIQKRFGVTCDVVYVGTLLHKLGFRCRSLNSEPANETRRRSCVGGTRNGTG